MSEYRVLGPVVVGLCVLGGAGIWLYLRLRADPAELERKRRLQIGQEGRLADGMITEVRGNNILYTYTIRGVGYAASQDITELRDLLPAEESHLVGPVMLKYARQNPANSVVLCEDWSGLPAPKGR